MQDCRCEYINLRALHIRTGKLAQSLVAYDILLNNYLTRVLLASLYIVTIALVTFDCHTEYSVTL